MLKNKVFNVTVFPDFSKNECTEVVSVQYKPLEGKQIVDKININSCSKAELRILDALISNSIELEELSIKKRKSNLSELKRLQKERILSQDEILKALLLKNTIDTKTKKIQYLSLNLEHVREKFKNEMCTSSKS